MATRHGRPAMFVPPKTYEMVKEDLAQLVREYWQEKNWIEMFPGASKL
jgi:hypothetical protein